MSHEIRAVREDELQALHDAMGLGFHFDSAGSLDAFRVTAEPERSRCVFDGSELVATSGAYTFQLSVPGGALPCSGVTWVTVRPTHRRRGLLRAMMGELLADARERGEPLAGLWASEASIYERFGFGCAADIANFQIERDRAAFRQPVDAPGRLRMVDAAGARAHFPALYARCAASRPGHLGRRETWWARRTLDPEFEREGGTAFRYVLYEEEGEVRGYLQYRVVGKWGASGLPESELHVIELQGLDGTAQAALWRFALDVDLVRKVMAWMRPVDDALPWLLEDPRRARRDVRDGLYLRLVDVAAALSGRRYASEGSLVLGVRDPACPWNDRVFELEGGPGGARCKPGSAEPDLRLSIEDLGALFLGGVPVAPLALAGRVQGEPEALARADRMLRWPVAPWCAEIF